MKKCRHLPTSVLTKLSFCLILLPVMALIEGFGVFYAAVALLTLDIPGLLISVFLILITWAVGRYCVWHPLKTETRRYSVSGEGIRVRNIMEREKLCLWDQVCEIGIFAFQANSMVTDYISVICCFSQPKPTYFNRKMVKAYFYPTNCPALFALIDYSDEALEELAKHYPKEIVDHRPEQVKMFNYETYQKLMEQKKV